MRKIIVDIDNTLWDLAQVLYERMVRVNPALTPHHEWREFDFWKKYVSPGVFYRLIRDIHMDQDAFTPYPDAASFLSSLKEEGFHIIIASHREKETLDATTRWLRAHNLVFDEIHLSYDKTVLFDDCFGIIDDSPLTLGKARETGVLGAGLKMPWNEYENYPLFDNLTEVLRFVNGLHDPLL
jgi:hypothetical protein